MAGYMFDHSAKCLFVRLFVAELCCVSRDTKREKLSKSKGSIFLPHPFIATR